MPTRNSTLAKKTVVRTYVRGRARLGALGVELLGLLVELRRLLLVGLHVLGHVGGARRRVALVAGGGEPRIERDLELGPEALLGQVHGLLVAGDVGGEPGVEGGRVEVAGLEGVGFARLASVRAVDARASVSCASVPHLADAKPEYAASTPPRRAAPPR